MYVPKEFSVQDSKTIDAFIASNPFISLVTTNGEYPIATHLPIVAKKRNNLWILEGHLALANRQSNSIIDHSNALCILLGPNAYISSRVYSHENVPTWNYQAVHLSGKLSHLEENELEKHLAQLVELFEKNRENPLDYADFSIDMLDAYKKEIIGFRFKVEKIEAAFKLSQNRNAIDRNAIIEDLEKCPFHGAKSIARSMKES